ncbi:hypothetical protein Glo7428_5239 (plasmid) [Gloeocapsa sp. PCC 7428]|nr:hypothetical protein Glo7428_5239 [Gloeocapsa sp. PCC 7428]
MKKLTVITGLLISTSIFASPARADYYNQNCSSYGNFDNCSGYDSYGGRYNYQGNQIGNFHYGTERYRTREGNEYERRSDVQRIGNTIYENNRIRTPYGDYNQRCTYQQVGSYVYKNCY